MASGLAAAYFLGSFAFAVYVMKILGEMQRTLARFSLEQERMARLQATFVDEGRNLLKPRDTMDAGTEH